MVHRLTAAASKASERCIIIIILSILRLARDGKGAPARERELIYVWRYEHILEEIYVLRFECGKLLPSQ